ncbi:MAG: tyrosine-type recombinase/integrase [Sedimenticola sp.]
MARASRRFSLETRTARTRLKVRGTPYWVTIGKGLALGYRKGAKTSSWVVRLDTGHLWPNGSRRQHIYETRTLDGVKPDDFEDADGVVVLDYFQAQEKARKFAAGERAKEHVGANPETYTVKQAMTDYLSDYKARSGKDTDGIKKRIEKHIEGSLGHKNVVNLTPTQIKRWLNRLVSVDESDLEVLRRQRSTANKQLTLLKAGLNLAFREGRVNDDRAWRVIQPFANVDAPKIRFLDEVQTRKLINACEKDFRPLVQTALLTGCRYGEVIRMKVADYDAANHSIHIPYSKSGKARHIPLTDEGVAFFDRAVTSKEHDSLIFMREDGEPWGKSHQARRMALACKEAGIKPAISFHILRHCYGAALAKAGVPLQVIAAALGHSDTRMTEKHYAHLQPDHIKETIRANLPEIGIEVDNVATLKGRKP